MKFKPIQASGSEPRTTPFRSTPLLPALLKNSMAFVPISEFDIEKVNIDLGPAQQSRNARGPQIKITYGPARRALGLLTPPIVADWPQLTGDGNFNSKFGPTDVDKASYTMGISDKRPAHAGEDNKEVLALFKALGQIDDKLCRFAHAHQLALFRTTTASFEEVKAKNQPCVRSKIEGDVEVYKRVNLSVKILAPSGVRRSVRVVDCHFKPTDAQVRHEDVCMVAMQLDFVYTGVMGHLYGIKWAPVEVAFLEHSAREQENDNIWGAVQAPQWAADAHLAATCAAEVAAEETPLYSSSPMDGELRFRSIGP